MNEMPGRSRGLLLLITVGSLKFGLQASQIVEVLPLLPVIPVALAPTSVVGFINHRGTMVPVIDLCRLLDGRDSRHWLASRIVVASITHLHKSRAVGLLVEGCSLLSGTNAELQPSLQINSAPFLGPLMGDDDGLVQLMNPALLLPTDILECLLGLSLQGHDVS